MRAGPALLLLVSLAAVGVGVAGLLHPGGFGGLGNDLGMGSVGLPGVKPANAGTKDGKDGKSGKPGAGGFETARASGLEEYDRGNFSLAYMHFNTASVVAPDAAARTELSKLANGALLAHFLVDGVAKSESRDPAGAYAARLSAAEAQPSERAWMDLARYAVQLGLPERGAYAAEKALAAARPGGPVQRHLVDCLGHAAERRNSLERALAARSLGVAGAQPPTSHPGPDEHEPFEVATGNDPGESSGIGGSGRKGVPLGSFDPELRERLRNAVIWETEGQNHYDAAGPSANNIRERQRHRHEALEKLKAAREVYQDALTQDPSATDVERRLSHVTQLIAFLRKDGGFNE